LNHNLPALRINPRGLTMKAMHCTAYGSPDVLKLREVEKPKPLKSELLIKIAATAVTSGDCEMRTCNMHPTMYLPFRLFMGIIKPRKPILGMYFSGTIEAVGKDVKTYVVGDEVFGTTGFTMGTNAEYVCIPASRSFIKKPKSLSHCEAAAAPLGAWNAVHFIRLAKLSAGEKILVFGAGGAIGTFFIGLAKLAGATVTAIDSKDKLPMLTQTGADFVIDYEEQDFTKSDQKYDVIFDVVGKSPYKKSLGCLNLKGRYILANVGFTPMIRGVWTSKTTDKIVISAMAQEGRAELIEISELLEAGKIRCVIDSTFTLEEIPEAHRYIDSGQRKGNTVVVMQAD
jgi:NADPH:quinone reductase-like Zn-dependent oxidoreductase